MVYKHLLSPGTMSAVARLRPILTPPLVKHTASLIFLHGSGDSGIGIKDWLTSATNGKFSFPHIRILYPTAPVRPYTAMDGFPTNVWFDRKEISPFVEENLDGLDEMCRTVRELVDVEVKNGIPRHRIMIGGFSMGGALALHCGFRFCQDVAGIFALSSFLNENSVVYKTIKEASGHSFPPLFQAHGNDDALVIVDWGRSTNQNLASLGVKTQFKVYPNVTHSLDMDEIGDLIQWIFQVLPDNSLVNAG